MQNNKQSIVQIIDRLNAGGAERVLIDLANIFYEKGHAIKVITIFSPGELADQLNKNISFVCLYRKNKWNPATMRRLIKEINDYDIVHVHTSYNLRYLYLASKIFGLNKPLFFHEHYGDIETDQKVLWHQKLIYPKTSLIAVSGKIEEWALSRLKMDKKKVFLLPNIIRRTADKSFTKKTRQNTIELLIVSNIRPAKNILFAINLLYKLKASGQDFYLTIIGKLADFDYYKQVESQIKKLQLSGFVHFDHACNNIQPLLHNFDLALHTAFSESGPLVLIEYMAQALPFITYHTGEVTAQVKNELSEYIISSFDSEEWIEQIKKLLNSDQQELKTKLLSTFEKYYSEESYYKECLSIYSYF